MLPSTTRTGISAGAGGGAELCARFGANRDLVDGVGETELGQALAYPVRGRAPFRLPQLKS